MARVGGHFNDKLDRQCSTIVLFGVQILTDRVQTSLLCFFARVERQSGKCDCSIILFLNAISLRKYADNRKYRQLGPKL